MNRPKNRALAYLRLSTDKQEIRLPNQLEWALAAAKQHDVLLDAAQSDLAHAQREGLHSYKGIRLDDGITGSDLKRPGFLALNHDALNDRSISHVLFYKRDRFARPDNAIEMAFIEKALSLHGITIVHSDGVSLPLRRGEQALLRDVELLFGYHQGGEELRKHAERVLITQRQLARDGYRVGGNAPYGFARVLVDAAGSIVEELQRGKTVRQPGCHVRAIPKDFEKIAIWLQILQWKEQGWGIKRIANQLNALGIPSPDAGRTRTRNGVKYRVSGKWSANAVGDLCRNAVIVGVQEYGKRSEGGIRRLGADGPRILEEATDYCANGRPRVLNNEASLRLTKQIGPAQFDAERWQSIQSQMDERGKNQRGMGRAKDPSQYPLSCCLVDLTAGCGSTMYARTTHGRAVYTCGKYMRTDCAECSNNQVDAEAILRFTLRTLGQFVDTNGRREKLRRKLLDRARAESNGSQPGSRARNLAVLKGRHAELTSDLSTIQRRLGREKDDDLYDVLKKQCRQANEELRELEQSIALAESKQTDQCRSPEAQAEAAMALLDNVATVATDPLARAAINPLLRHLGLRIGLAFQPTVKGKRRVVQRLVSGRIVFGGAPLPAIAEDDIAKGSDFGYPKLTRQGRENGPEEKHRLPNAKPGNTAVNVEVVDERRREMLAADAGASPESTAAVDECSPTQLQEGQPQGISTTKVNRGDRI